MFEVDEQHIWDYFRGPGASHWKSMGLSDSDFSQSTAATLAWGVSNIVLRVETPAIAFVLKQSRRQLRTKIDWFSRLERIWREADMLRVLAKLAPPGSVPGVVFEDRENYLFAMQAVAANHRVWKAELLAGRVDAAIAEWLGTWLGIVHRQSSGDEQLRVQFGDTAVFDELRLDPFYRYVAEHDESMAHPLRQLVSETLNQRDCLVLADFSPKNILLTENGPVVVDFETGHYGDPGFDVGFFLSHLLLKTVLHAGRGEELLSLAELFWLTYQAALQSPGGPSWATVPTHRAMFDRNCVRHLAACLLARVDGKSRIDYLSMDSQTDLVRMMSHDWLHRPLSNCVEAFSDFKTRLLSGSVLE